MAPIATPTAPSPSQTPAVDLRRGTGDYKEQASGLKEYKPELEEVGEGKAHVNVLN